MLSRNLVPWEASRARISGGPRLARTGWTTPINRTRLRVFIRNVHSVLSTDRMGLEVLKRFRSRLSIHEVSVFGPAGPPGAVSKKERRGRCEQALQ